ncbi:GNAT family N-acetyltransferase [Marinicella sp. W31]|uniref:GNAT family N-acetyltransferase n=1 Tax=Marinicella sp. W31 TaxID=3023713 RepID=UPI0037572086
MIVYKDYHYLPLTEQDKAFYISVYQDQKVMSYVMEIPDLKTCERFFAHAVKQQQQPVPEKLVFTVKKDADFIGLIGIYWNQQSKDAVEIGTLIKTAFQCKGYGSDTTLGLARYALSELNVKQVVLISEVGNQLASGSARKMGFKKSQETEENRLGRICNRWVLESF